MKLKVMRDYGAFTPTRAHDADAGLDIYATQDKVIFEGSSEIFHTGIHVQIPAGHAGLLVSKSGLNVKHDITSTGLIDEGYTGEIIVKLFNHGKTPYHVCAGDKISQLVIIPVEYCGIEIVDDFEATPRGDNGFGSTGR